MKIKSMIILSSMALVLSFFGTEWSLLIAGFNEPLAVNTRNVPYYYIYNNQLQIATRLSERGMIDHVTAFRKRLFNEASLILNGTPVNMEQLAVNTGRVTISGQEYVVTTRVTIGGQEYKDSLLETGNRGDVRFIVESNPAAPVTYRVSLNQEIYNGQIFSIDGKESQFKSGKDILLAETQSPNELIIGSLSKQRLTIQCGAGIDLQIRRGPNAEIWLDFIAKTGTLNFSIVEPPYEAIKVALTTDHFHNIYDVQESGNIAITADFVNATSQERQFNYKARMTDFEGNEVFVDTVNSQIVGPSGVLKRVLKPKLSHLGFYKIVLEATDTTSGEDFRRFLTLGIIKSVQRPNPPAPSGKFGVHFFARAPEPAKSIEQIGITWTREDIYWINMEPTRGTYNWSMDTRIANATEAGLWILPVNGNIASWALTGEVIEDKWFKSTKVDLEAWGKWWSEMAKRYKGKVGAWEVANEGFYGLPVSLNVDLHQTAYNAIKAQDPVVPVVASVTGGMVDGGMLNYLKEFLAAGGDKGCDVISAHPYTQNHKTSPEQGLMRELGERVNKVISPYFKNPRLWWTEYGWMGDDEYNRDIPGVETDWAPKILNERTQAQYIIRAYLAGIAARVEHMFYFLDQDTSREPFPSGLLREEGIRPAYCAINTICRVLEYTDFVQDIKLRDDVQIMVFKGKEYSSSAVWCTTSPERKYVLRVPLVAGDVEVINFMGNIVQFPKDAKEISIPFDGSPAYITSRNLSPQQLAQTLSKARIEEGVSVSSGNVPLKPRQLIVNPGLESDWNGWVTEGSKGTIDTSIFHSGSRSLRYDGFKSCNYVNYQGLYIDPQETYEFKVWVKTQDLVKSAHLLLLRFDNKGKSLGYHSEDGSIELFPTQGTSDWVEKKLLVRFPPETAIVNIYLRILDTTGKAWFDDVSLEEVND